VSHKPTVRLSHHRTYGPRMAKDAGEGGGSAVSRTAAIDPGCVKTQKRPHVVPFKLDWISGEVGFRWNGVSVRKPHNRLIVYI